MSEKVQVDITLKIELDSVMYWRLSTLLRHRSRALRTVPQAKLFLCYYQASSIKATSQLLKDLGVSPEEIRQFESDNIKITV